MISGYMERKLYWCKGLFQTAKLIDRNRGGESKAHRYPNHRFWDGGAEWRVIGVYLAKEDSHACCVVPNGAYPSEEYELLSGELASAVNLMMERLRYQYHQHASFPVRLLCNNHFQPR